jgi:uncharacterized protein
MLPLIVREATSATAASLLQEDGDVAVWWGTWVECAAALSRLAREGKLDEETEAETRSRLDLLADHWREIPPIDNVRLLAALLSKDHPLKAADALQLAAALRWCEGDTGGTGFVCLDGRLAPSSFMGGLRRAP